jgi:hypothetical protein
MRAYDIVSEVNFPDELNISEMMQEFFFKRGYKLLGEGRDQMAFLSPRNTVVKVVGLGEQEREQVVRDYVAYFVANQRNPYYPKIYSTNDFTVGGETYFIYEMEYLRYIANEEDTLDYLENLMNAITRDSVQEFMDKHPVPKELNINEINGLIMATDQLITHLGGTAPLDLRNVENLARRDDGHIVILDPFSL